MRLLTAIILLSASLWAAIAHGGEDAVVLAGGENIRVLYFEPMDAVSPPLAIMVSGGYSNEFMARAQFWLGKELVDRGWAVAVPISPGGRDFFVEHASEFPKLIRDLQDLHGLTHKKTLLVGISSGGSAALEIAAVEPQNYMGVVATPGRITGESTLGHLDGLPVYLRIGEKDDFRWNREYQAVVARLKSAGAAVNSALVPGAKHVFPVDWLELEPWLAATVQGQ